MKHLASILILIFALLLAISAQAQVTSTITVDFSAYPSSYCQNAFSYPLSAAVWSALPAPTVSSTNAGGPLSSSMDCALIRVMYPGKNTLVDNLSQPR